MDIHDVIGSLRSQILELKREIDAHRLAIHMCEYQLSVLQNPSGTTTVEKGLSNGDTQLTIEEYLPPPAPEASVGKDSRGRQRGERRTPRSGTTKRV